MAFPTTLILDGFDRANEGPPPSSGWTTGIDGSTGGFSVTSNRARAENGTLSSAYWNAANFGPDVEVYATLGPTVGPSRLHWRMQQEGTAGWDGYTLLAYTPTNELYIYRVDNGTQTQLGAAIAQTLANGDSFGISMVGDTITIYYKTAAGSWASLGTRTDSTYTSAGKIAISAFDQVGINLDDFGGGSIETTTTFPRTAVLDDFNRADENPASGWTQVFSSNANIQVVSNQIASTSQTYGIFAALPVANNQEAYVDVSAGQTGGGASGARLAVLLHISGETSDAATGYLIQMFSTVLRIYRLDDIATFVELSSIDLGAALTAGDKLGARIEGDLIEAWTNIGGAGWVLRDSVSDSTYPLGKIGVGVRGDDIWLDNFGGGVLAYTGAVEQVGLFDPEINPLALFDEVLVAVGWFDEELIEALLPVVTVPVISINVSAAAPAVTTGSVTLTVPVASITTTAIAPIVSFGVLTLTVPAVTVAVSAASPSVSLFALSQSSSVATVSVSATAPSVTLSAVSVNASVATVALSAIAPTRTLGAVSRSVPVASVTASVNSPSIIAGTRTLTVSVASINALALSPSITVSAVSQSVSIAGVSTTATAPSIVLGTAVFTVPVASVSLSASPPMVVLGGISVAATIAAVAVSADAPLVVLSGAGRSASVATVAVQLISPDVVGGPIVRTVSVSPVLVAAVNPLVVLGAVIAAAGIATVRTEAAAASTLVGLAVEGVSEASVTITAVSPDTGAGVDEGPAYSAILTLEPKPGATVIVEPWSAVVTIVPKPTVILTKWA